MEVDKFDRSGSSYFSADFSSARSKFLEAARAASARIQSFKHPSVGPAGQPLFTDVAVIGPSDADAVLIVGSGTHGVEGFAGSAIQTGLLCRGFSELRMSNTRLVLIHAINPFGFAYLRRTDEDNVDLNRNFVDHDKPHPDSPGYDALASALLPKSISPMADLAALMKLLTFAATKGTSATQAVITSGQYTHPAGLFYGGRSTSWSAETLNTIVQAQGAGARRLAFVDVHTGLGPAGHGEIILSVPIDSATYERAKAWWGEPVKTTKTGESVAADLTGAVKLAIPEMLPGVEVTAVELEFGTVPALRGLIALRKENWLWQYGCEDHPNANKIRMDLLKASCPDDAEWHASVWAQGRRVVEQAIHGLRDGLEASQGEEPGTISPIRRRAAVPTMGTDACD